MGGRREGGGTRREYENLQQTQIGVCLVKQAFLFLVLVKSVS